MQGAQRSLDGSPDFSSHHSARDRPGRPWGPGRFVAGRRAAFEHLLNGSLTAQTLRFDQGSITEIELRNEPPEPTIPHWYRLVSLEGPDGHPPLAIGPGEMNRYHFEVVVLFDQFRGVVVMHRHNLEHEESGVMMNFQVLD